MGIGQRPKEPRQRVLISTQYERKIDQIEERLGRIESLLSQLPGLIKQSSSAFVQTPVQTSSSAASFFDQPYSQQQHTPTPPVAGTSSTSSPANERLPSVAIKTDVDPVVADEDDADIEGPFEGDSSMTAHTVFASEFLHLAVGRTSLQPGQANSIDNSSLHNALSSLQQIVHMQKRGSTIADVRFLNQKPVPAGGLRELPMPPLGIVVDILRELKGKKCPSSVLLCTFFCCLLLPSFSTHSNLTPAVSKWDPSRYIALALVPFANKHTA